MEKHLNLPDDDGSTHSELVHQPDGSLRWVLRRELHIWTTSELLGELWRRIRQLPVKPPMKEEAP